MRVYRHTRTYGRQAGTHAGMHARTHAHTHTHIHTHTHTHKQIAPVGLHKPASQRGASPVT